MPLPWVWPPASIPKAVDTFVAPAAQQVGPQRRSIDGELVVEWKHEVATDNPRVIHFTGGIKAIYGPTTIFADELTLFLDDNDRHGEAVGHVRLMDPEGSATANSLIFNWRLKTGKALLVKTEVEGVSIDAREIDINPGRWDIYDFTSTNWRGDHPLYLLNSAHALIEPGKRAVVEKPRITLLGIRMGPFPNMHMDLDRRAGGGMALPSISYRKDRGFGLSWNGSTMLNEQTAFSGSFGTFRHFVPSFGFQLSRSLLGPDKTDQTIVPRTELNERFNASYLDNVTVKGLDNDEIWTRAPRSTLAICTFQNITPSDRLQNARYTKPYDLVYEAGGGHKDLGLYGQVRYQSVRQYLGPSHNRAVFQGAVNLRPQRISHGLESHIRVDGAAYSGGTNFGWGRVEGGLTYKPIDFISLGAAAFQGSEVGDPFFQDDRLYVRRGYTARLTLNGASTQLSLLGKWNAEGGEMYDREIELSQVVGGLQAYIIYRKFPGDYRLGIELRLDSFFGALQKRRTQRATSSP